MKPATGRALFGRTFWVAWRRSPSAPRQFTSRWCYRAALRDGRHGAAGLAKSNAVLKRIGARTDNPLSMAIGGEVTKPRTISVGDLVRPA